jgi:hypothetical protein
MSEAAGEGGGGGEETVATPSIIKNQISFYDGLTNQQVLQLENELGQALDENLDLDVNYAKLERSLWLVKLPQFLRARWEHVMNNTQSSDLVNLGTLRIYHGTSSNPGSTTKVTVQIPQSISNPKGIKLDSNPDESLKYMPEEETPIPAEYSLLITHGGAADKERDKDKADKKESFVWQGWEEGERKGRGKKRKRREDEGRTGPGKGDLDIESFETGGNISTNGHGTSSEKGKGKEVEEEEDEYGTLSFLLYLAFITFSFFKRTSHYHRENRTRMLYPPFSDFK